MLLPVMRAHPCSSSPSLTPQSCLALFWYLVVTAAGIFFFHQRFFSFLKEIPTMYPPLEPLPVSAIAVSTALTSCTQPSCWQLKYCYFSVCFSGFSEHSSTFFEILRHKNIWRCQKVFFWLLRGIWHGWNVANTGAFVMLSQSLWDECTSHYQEHMTFFLPILAWAQCHLFFLF